MFDITCHQVRLASKRKTQGGCHQVRTVLYIAMMSAMQCNPIFKTTHQRLVAAGKPKKVAIIACARKMIVILNSMVREGVMWDATTVKINYCRHSLLLCT